MCSPASRYCTGGVRCEKASAYLRSRGVTDVSQLSGGIHRYLEKYGSEGEFLGSNMVFDGRGLQRPPGAAVIARCYCCGTGNEQMSSDRVCAVCRDSVVVCDPCRVERASVYFCDVHAALEGTYFPFLEGFSRDEVSQPHPRALTHTANAHHTHRKCTPHTPHTHIPHHTPRLTPHVPRSCYGLHLPV